MDSGYFMIRQPAAFWPDYVPRTYDNSIYLESQKPFHKIHT